MAALLLSGVVAVAGLLRGLPAADMIVTAVSLTVAAVPESLPAVVTLALAIGAHRMARRSAVVRRLPAVETLGSVTVVAADKTGTLTEGVMLAERVWTEHGEFIASGNGYAPAGGLVPFGDAEPPTTAAPRHRAVQRRGAAATRTGPAGLAAAGRSHRGGAAHPGPSRRDPIRNRCGRRTRGSPNCPSTASASG